MARLDDERRIGAIQIDPLGDELRHVPPADPSRPVDLRPASPDQRALERGRTAGDRKVGYRAAKRRDTAEEIAVSRASARKAAIASPVHVAGVAIVDALNVRPVTSEGRLVAEGLATGEDFAVLEGSGPGPVRVASFPDVDVTEHLGDVPSATTDPKFNPDLRELAGIAEFEALSQPDFLGHGHGLVFSLGMPIQGELADEAEERFEATLTAADPDS